MKFKNFVPAILAILRITEWTKSAEEKNTLTEDQENQLKTMGFNDTFVAGFKTALENDFKEDEENGPKTQEQRDTRAAVLQGLLQDTTVKLAQANAELETMRSKASTDAATIQAKETEITNLNARIQTLSKAAEQDPGKGAGLQADAAVAFNLNDENQLAGMEGAMYAMDRPYNVRARAALLQRQGLTMMVPVASSMDYSRLREDLGAFYRIPWMDRLQSFLVQLPSIESIFPLESGYQDLATLVNIWLGEFSQPDNTESDFDNVVKGNYEFDNETLRMFDVMFAHRFKNLKQLEKLWIGSLNLEGSNPIKWSFIEYILAEDGIYEFLRKKIDGHVDINNGKTVFQIKPFVLGEITQANIGEKFYEGTSMIPAEIRDSGSLALYIPSYMLVWYHKYNELHYGTNQDYKANINYVKEYPSVKIITVPNADNHARIFWTMEGNIHTYEHLAGEMYNFNLEQEDWSLKVWSNWKESIWAVAVGFKYTKKADMDGSRQMIWANEYDRPASNFVDAEKDKNPDATVHSSIQTVANTSKLAITDITNAEVGQVITLKCGSTEFGVEIAVSGKFSLISAKWDPAKGDTITLMKRSDGKFIEIGRATAATDALQFTDDDTTPSVANGTVFVTGANTDATAITKLDDAEVGTTYTIYGAGTTNASTIANAGNFVLTEAMTLSEGHFIKLVAASDNKFYKTRSSSSTWTISRSSPNVTPPVWLSLTISP